MQTVRAQPGRVQVLCFSPLTSVALAIALEPRLPALVAALVAMGGALGVPGNASPLAEANFLHDAAAARAVLAAFAAPVAAPLVLAPLDVTMAPSAMLRASHIAQIRAAGSRSARALADAWTVYQRAYCAYSGTCDGAPPHDAHPVAYAVDPTLFTTSVVVRGVDVILTPAYGATGAAAFGAAHGMTVRDRRAQPASAAFAEESGRDAQPRGVHVLLDVDGERFVRALVACVTRAATGCH